MVVPAVSGSVSRRCLGSNYYGETKPGWQVVDSSGRFWFYYGMPNLAAARRFSVLTALLALSLWCAWSPGAWAGERVQDPAGLFSFVPPPGWAVSMVHSTKESEVRVDLADQGAFMTIAAREVPGRVSWAKWKKALLDSMSQALSGVQSGPYKLCGREALSLVGNPKDSPGDTVEVVAMEGKGIGLVLTMTYPSKLWRNFRPTLKEVLSSLNCTFVD